MSAPDWRAGVPVGALVELTGGHPWEGYLGRVVRHELAPKVCQDAPDVLAVVVSLHADDALHGHEVGITTPDQVRALPAAS